MRFSRRALRGTIVALGVACILYFVLSDPRVVGQSTAVGQFELKPGDHICIIGNTLAERMQHDGWLETVFHARLPEHNLSFRNLGFSGDDLNVRLRSANFGTPDSWLNHCKADVVFAFFGYNESFQGKDGLDKFKNDLDDFVKKTVGQKYNGKTGPRLVLFSPIAHEKLPDVNLPDGKDNNARLELYTAAMQEVGKTNKVPVVDLFHATQDLYARAKEPLTINGVHLNEHGNLQLAEFIDRLLFGAPLGREAKSLEKLRQAVLDQNFHWYNRYRTVDGYSIYGGRADLKFTAGQTNRVVMQREMEILDVMTANRDKRIWGVAQGKDVKVEDNNLPPFYGVVTNKPGTLPGGKHLFLDGEEAIKKMTIAQGLKVNLFASEKEFPELANPVQMSFDPKGRLWVAVWPTYPHWKPLEPMNDKLLIFEDTNGDGKADKMITFADNLHCPTGFEFWNGGVIIAQMPDLMFLKDTNGDDRADVRQRILHGLDSADTHHAANSFVLDPGGALYFQEGTFHHTQVETPYGPPVRNANAGVFRYEPRTQKFETYVNYGFANPHGHVVDRWGQDFVIDGTGANPFHAALFSGHMPFGQRHARPPQLYNQTTRPCPGMEILSSRHFPESWQGDLLVANVIGFHGILRVKLSDKGASFHGVHQDPLLSSSDPSFRPSDLRVGPDGALYFLDWQNPIIGHMQHNLRDPSRDREHGRIYRVTYAGNKLLTPARIAGEPIEKLLDLLKEPEDRVRYRTRIELGGRPTKDVIAATKKWIDGLDAKDADHDHHLTEALWLHQNHNVVDVDLLKRMLGAKDFRARAAATRVLCYQRDRMPEALELLKKQADDAHPRVRLEAIRAASFFKEAGALEVVLVSAEKPTDTYLDFVRGETMKAIDPYVKAALKEGKRIPFTSIAGARYFLKNVATDELLKMPRDRAVFHELIFRKGVRDEFRREALTGLAKVENKSEMAVLIDAFRAQDEQAAQEESVAFDLVRLLTARADKELLAVRADLEKLALNAHSPVTRQLGFIALIAGDGTIDKAWDLAVKSPSTLQDLVGAMPLIRDPGQRAALYPRVKPLLTGLPKELAKTEGASATMGRFVRVELPGKGRTLTLAEVEVYSGGRNVARQGRASQKSTASGGEASRGIDGNTSGAYGAGGQTHTAEKSVDPWWEVDLGAVVPIQSIVLFNRTDPGLGTRLDKFTVKVLDASRNTVYERVKQPAPAVKVKFEVGSEPTEFFVRRAAMFALTSVRGQEEATFTDLARFITPEIKGPALMDRQSAIQAMSRIPSSYWPKDQAKMLLQNLLAVVREIPVKERTTSAAVDALQLADSLATLLPLKEARQVRAELGELAVRVIRVGTIPDQMLFDQERIVVKAGKAVEILLENTDLMPHNLVITQPGSLEEIGVLAEASATQPGAAARQYVPVSNKVLHATKLVAPRDSDRLSFTAPAKPGVYPVVCTYPGHWRRMYAAMYVVSDLDEYLADPEGYLAKNPLPVADELLKFNRPRKEWKFEELASSVQKFEPGRNYATGKQMFQVANCLACHKFGAVGVAIGPDLTKLDPKVTATDILKDILEPSFKIHEKYQTWAIETVDGKVLTGLILEETGDTIKLVENPLAKGQTLTLKKSAIAERKKSPNSIMPRGLTDRLSREEILDLVAFIVSRGDPRHPLFLAGHEHGHKGH